MGTVRYMSPEQVRGQQVDHRTDIYSLACTLYEALGGETPFDGDTHFEIMTKHLSEPAVSLRSRGVDCPPALDAAVLRGLSKSRDRRPDSAREMRELLEACLRGDAPAVGEVAPEPVPTGWGADAERTDAAPPLREPSRARPTLWVSLAVLVAAAGAGVVTLLRRGGEEGQVAAGSTEAGSRRPSPAWPEPFVLTDTLAVVADRTFADERVRVVSELDIDLTSVRDAVRKGHAEFLEYLRAEKVSGEIGDHPLNVVVVKSRHVLCDPRLHRGRQVPAQCAALESHYLPTERTVYVVGTAASLVRNLKIVQADNVCLHTQLDGCDAAAIGFGDRLSREP
jgi:hypothetical protein